MLWLETLKIRADIEMKYFQFDGVLHIKVFFIFTLYNTSNHNHSLKLGASSPEEAARWIHALQDVAMEPGTISKRRWQPFRLSDAKGPARKHSVDWTSSAHSDTMTSYVIASLQWKIFGCKNGLRLFKEAKDGNSSERVIIRL